MEEKNRNKKDSRTLKRVYRFIYLISGVTMSIAAILFFSPLGKGVFNGTPPSLPASSPKDSPLDLPLTFYRTLTKNKGEREKNYTVQVSAYKRENYAKNLVGKLKKKGYSAYIASSETSLGKKWYRVRIGHFTTKESANEFAKKVRKKEKISTLVIRTGF